jgi:drug/metabolite transporter (DMT)-like permease
LGILLGLAAALGWGSADFLARHSARRIGSYSTFVFIQCVGLVGLSLYLVIARDRHWSGLSAALVDPARQAWEWAIVGGLLNIAATVSLYRAFAVGKAALVAPIGACYPALTILLALAAGERPDRLRALGIPIVLAGMILASIPRWSPAGLALKVGGGRRPRAERGVGWALAAAAGFGVLFWLIGFHVAGVLGGVLPVWLFRLMGAAALPFLILQPRAWPAVSRGGLWWPLVSAGLLDTTAFVSNNIGLTTEQVSVVTVLSSLFGAVTLLLAWIFLRERLSARQWLGIGLILAGVVLVSL